MTFDEVLTRVLEMLQRQGRISYRALQRRLNLDDTYLDDLKIEIIQAKLLAVDEGGTVLVWTGSPGVAPSTAPRACIMRQWCHLYRGDYDDVLALKARVLRTMEQQFNLRW
jgi:hypothetical protein